MIKRFLETFGPALFNRVRQTIPAIVLLVVPFVAAAATPTLTPPPPDVAARGYILLDHQSGRVIAEQKADERMEPASLTKIMAAYIVFNELTSGKIRGDDEVLISEKAWRMAGSRTFVEVDTKVPVETLLKGMIVQSGNDATVALAEHVAGAEEVFATLMNQTAKTLGLNSTHYVNSTGLPDPDHYTTARDMALLAQALIRDFPDYYEWYGIREFTYNGITQYNRNKLLWRDDSVDGVKTGHTEAAGYCLVSSARQDDMRLIAVILGAGSENARARESQKLLSYGFRFFETHRLYAPMEQLTTVKVWKGVSDELALGLSEDLYVTIPRGQYDRLNAAMKIQPAITAPVDKGTKLGTVEITLSDTTIAQAPLVAMTDVSEAGFFRRLMDDVWLMFE